MGRHQLGTPGEKGPEKRRLGAGINQSGGESRRDKTLVGLATGVTKSWFSLPQNLRENKAPPP